jgi:NAD(P)-dependent dehydrogenase (short-subunit alcohol dehydrogenase family)
MGRIDGRVAVVTGAGDGIGRGIARRYAAEGARVVVADFNAESGARVAGELRDELGAEAVFVPTDVRSRPDVLAMVDAARDRWGTIDILVNNAWSGGDLSRVERKSDDMIASAFAVTFYGPLWAMRHSFPTMKANSWGRVINICSLNGVNAHMGTVDYNCAKEALRTLSRTAAREWAPYGICVNVICPAALTSSARTAERSYPGLIQRAAEENPMKRMGDPEGDIAPVALFLASDDCSYLTGNTLFVDGGSHINGSSWRPQLPDGDR